MTYPKRLIEVDLPIKRISAHARREKSIRHGHISTLHIWWARRPLAACRAVICAALWPDPADKNCPAAFRNAARREMQAWISHDRQELLSAESRKRFEKARKRPELFKNDLELRGALLDFIADFANWDNSTNPEFLATSRALTQAAHEALGGEKGTRPLVVDPFAGGGSIPLEALRVGADAFASDLNPIPVLLNKVVLEYIPKYGQRLADEVRKWGEWIKQEAERELAEFYPKDKDGSTPIAYLWARTIKCEGPGCGAEVPLMRSRWLAKTDSRSVALQLVPRPRSKRVDFQIIVKKRGGWVDQDEPKTQIADPILDGTVARGSVTCPCCGYTTQVARVREQFKTRHGGANDARLLCVVTIRENELGRFYRLPTETDLRAIREAGNELARRKKAHKGKLSLTPDELISKNEMRRISIPIYGMASWGDVFSNRQSLSLQTLARIGCKASKQADPSMTNVLTVLFALALGRQADACSSLARWHTTGEKNTGTFGRQALGMVWDFCEVNPFSGSTGGWEGAVQWIAKVCESQAEGDGHNTGQVQRASATAHPLSDDIASAWITDPPYYDSVPYAHLSDYFYVWMRRMLHDSQPDLFGFECVPKEEEVVVDRPHSLSESKKDVAFYERELTKAFAEGRRVLRPDGIGAIVFASKTTASWEAILKAVIDAGWIITGSWPIDTEMEARVAAQGQARLASSVHLVCRPRENPDGSVRKDEVGDWRDVLAELPRRIHEWMPRLAEEGVVGADAIFACLGPALEIFSRYSRVEKSNGDPVTLKEYLENVWAAVSKEALNMIFSGADATGFEEDARLTAMWLWTLKTDEADAANGNGTAEAEGEDDENAGKKSKTAGFTLEFDAARKIAQGLGAHLEDLTTLVAVEGETARLLPVAERARALFGKDEGKVVSARKKREPQMDLFKVLQSSEDGESTFGEAKVQQVGNTVLDRIHQSMILFAAGRGEALKRFLADDGAGRDARFWTLAQALSALYPGHTEEKRWVDGVLARKKGLGF
jgi:adenine-specific DNA methylase